MDTIYFHMNVRGGGANLQIAYMTTALRPFLNDMQHFATVL